MYRTPMRRGFSPDSPKDVYRKSSASPPHNGRSRRSWSRSRSPDRKRSPPTRGRSPPTRGRSPPTRGRRSPPTRGPSPAGRRARSLSRPGTSRRSKSRNRSKSRHRSKSRPRKRLSISPYSQRSGDGYSYEGRDQRRYSPSYGGRSPRGSRSPDRHRSDSSRGPSTYSTDSPRRTEEPLPMPKKSILKKRTDVETTIQDPSSQVDSYSSLGKSSSTLLTNVGNVLPGDMRTSQISPSIIQRSSSTLVTGISSAAAGGISLATKEALASNSPLNPSPNSTANDPLNRPHTSAGNCLGSPEIPFGSPTSFLNAKEVSKGPSLGDGYLPLQGPVMSEKKLATTAASFPEKKQELKRSLTEIEEEERFLYGDEEEKTPEPSKGAPMQSTPMQSTPMQSTPMQSAPMQTPPKQTPPKQTPPANVPKNTPDEKEYAKIHDLLKTIGLDIGVAEIGKLAVRTQERLHGKKLIPKVSPTPSQQPQQPQNTIASPSVAKPKPEAEQKQKVVPKVAAKNERPVKQPMIKKPASVAQQTGPTVKEKTPAVTPKTAAEQSQPASKIETIGQQISTVQSPSVGSVQAISTVQSITTVQTPPVLVQPPPVAPVPEMTPPPISPSQVPMYSPYTPSPMMHNFSVPPPSFNPFSPYVSFPTSNWTMYPPPPVHQPPPPPTHIPPPVSSPHLPTPQTNPRSNLRVIETHADFEAAAKNEPKTPTTGLLAKHEAERRNKEAEKLKVLEELDALKQDLKAKTLSLKNLSTKVEQLRVQHGILLRKKRREKDGHKDPLLAELSNVMDSARRQISSLNGDIFETKHKQQQLIKVAEILGATPMDLADKKETYKEREKSPLSPRDSSSDAKSSGSINDKNDSKERRDSSPAIDKKADVKPKGRSDSSGDVSPSASTRLSEKAEDDVKPKPSSRSPKRRSDRRSDSESSSSSSSDSEESEKSYDKSRSRSPRSSAPPLKVSPKKEDPSPFEVGDIFEYYDSGGHWCEDCNSLCMNVLEFLLHFHEKKHHESLKQPQRPWVKTKKTEVSSPKRQKVTVALKGAEFMVPTKGYYCSLCDQSFPDHVEADEHLRTYSHNEKFKKYTDEYINYEVSRRERKKASLSAAQEAARKQAEQKRKLQNEEHSRSKKAKRDHEVKKVDKSNSRRRSRTPSSPVRTDPKRKSKTPDKEPVKAPTFGKFTWKPTDDKNQATGNTEKVEGEAGKEKEEEAKGQNAKSKGIEIKLLGKPSNSQGKSPTSSSSTPYSSTQSSATSTLTTASIAASFNMPNSSDAPRIKVRPNLPVPLALLRKSNMTVNKPAPLNTFLSIKSADATSKSLPVMKSSAKTILSEDIVSKAFEGEEVVLKETKSQPIQTATKKDDANKNLVPTPTPSPKTTPTSQPNRGSELYDMLFKKVPADALREGAKAKAGQSGKASSSSKPASSTHASKTGSSNSSKLTESKSSEKLQQEKSTSQSSQSPGHAAASRISEAQSKNVLPEPAKGVAGSSTNSTSKGQNLIGPLPKKEMGPVETKTVSKPEKVASQAGQGPSLSMNPLTGRLEYSSMQVSKPNETYKMKSPEVHKMKSPEVHKMKSPDTNKMKPLETNKMNPPETTKTNPPEAQKDSVTHIQTGEIKPLRSVGMVVEPSKPSYNSTSKLNQKFKREPLSLPTSLFGHISDPGCKDIKITHIATTKPTTDMKKSSESRPSSYSASVSNQTMQQELDSYYKLIATEEDPADLIPSEDEDPEAEVASAPHKVEIPEKKMKLENPPPAVKASANPMVPDVASEDVDDSDMACEVPDGPASNFSTSGLGMVQSSYSFSPTFGAKYRPPYNYSRGIILMDRDYTKKTPPSTTAASYSVEELEALTTCDSD
ncbi:zinc finger protein 318 isoform X2 [Lithobates pipiens]